jgi:hypothetical protein
MTWAKKTEGKNGEPNKWQALLTKRRIAVMLRNTIHPWKGEECNE